MKILFTGATGVVGRVAIPGLVAADHIVDAVARSDEGRGTEGALIAKIPS